MAHGILLAFDDAALVASPTFTDLSSLTGVRCQGFTIKRGRPTERDKTGIGTAGAKVDR